ncbi:hypothetical protein BJ912DRAFT_1065385 [Pholiota molesta]|nr:hypothetical protein BJ912DRAFT_1065385 [Pholiota molesta]
MELPDTSNAIKEVHLSTLSCTHPSSYIFLNSFSNHAITTSFLALLAAAQSVVGFPFGSSEAETALAPVPVTKLVCDGNTYVCTANLDFGDGNGLLSGTPPFSIRPLWRSRPQGDHGRYGHGSRSGHKLQCDGDTTSALRTSCDFGDGRWVAQWGTSVFHQGLRSGNGQSLAPVPVTKLVCDGDSYKCTGNLDFGDGRWVAQWNTAVFHTGNFLGQN